mmetsp:Transcript_126227/g.353520  ORF Transcript_126227/g.353520 Transcript_126227/m.353520 type:complete len:214 (-) Transcript_126227:404-1045(-)
MACQLALTSPRGLKTVLKLSVARTPTGPATRTMVAFTPAAWPVAFAARRLVLSVATSMPLSVEAFAALPAAASCTMWAETISASARSTSAAWEASAPDCPSSAASASQPSVSAQTRWPSGATEQTPSCGQTAARSRRASAVRLAESAAKVAAASASALMSRAAVASSTLSPHMCISKRLDFSGPPHISFWAPSQCTLHSPWPPVDFGSKYVAQ